MSQAKVIVFIQYIFIKIQIIMKTKLLFIGSFLVISLLLNVVKASDPVYLNVISNTSKTIDYTVGVYPLKLKPDTENNRTTITMYVLNNGSKDLFWTKEDHVLIILKDHTLKLNYVTKAESGAYCSAYVVNSSKGFHEQTLCFDGIFTANDIEKVYLLQANDLFTLDYLAGDNK